MGFFTRLFGQECKVRFEGTLYDGRVFTGKCRIETFNINNDELEQNLKNLIFVETGDKVGSVKVLGFAEH